MSAATVVCVSCGNELPLASRGRAMRCKSCSNRRIADARSEEVAQQDGWLLEQVAAKRSASAIAAELGLTRQAVYVRIKKAQVRAGGSS